MESTEIQLSAVPLISEPMLEPEKPRSQKKINFIIPETYMNLSGEPVYAAASFFKIPVEKILVVHDELELPPGTVSLKFSGGLGGHNGLRSMKTCFGSADFWRLRIGIGRPGDREPGKGGKPISSDDPESQNIVDWVLTNFTPEEMRLLTPSLEATANLLSGVLLYGPEAFLPEWKKKKIAVPDELRESTEINFQAIS